MPHLVLEEIPIPPLRARYQLKDKNHHDAAPDISFLKLKCRTPEKQYTLTATQFTLETICWDGTKWTAYAFGSNAEEPEEPDQDDLADDKPEEDLIAAHTGHCLDTEDPILDPRLYWLINVEHDISKSADEWGKLLWRVETGFKVCVDLIARHVKNASANQIRIMKGHSNSNQVGLWIKLLN